MVVLLWLVDDGFADREAKHAPKNLPCLRMALQTSRRREGRCYAATIIAVSVGQGISCRCAKATDEYDTRAVTFPDALNKDGPYARETDAPYLRGTDSPDGGHGGGWERSSVSGEKFNVETGDAP